MDIRQEDEPDPFEVFGEPDAVKDRGAPFDAPQVSTPAKTGVSWAGLAGGAASLAWAGGMAAGIVDHYGGPDALLQLALPVQAALAAWTFAPALLFWIAASAAGEALKARRLAAKLVGGAPFSAAAQAQRADVLNESLAAAAARMAELESTLERNVETFDSAVEASREGAEATAQALQQEREALTALNADLRHQTEAMAQSIGRQIRLLREASKLARAEIAAAEQALEQQFASFDSLATVMSERTAAIRSAADAATAATCSLNGVMSNMLDGLAEATRLADAARQSSEHAVVAANDTAGALREATQGAVLEAKRAAQAIREETAALKRSPAEALALLQDAAHVASEESYAVSQRHAVSAGKRTVASPAPARETPRAPAAQKQSAEPHAAPSRHSRSWTTSPSHEPPAPANEDSADLVDFVRPSDADASLKRAALGIVASAGVLLERALGPEDLDRIARCSRDGGAARRRAVTDAAPGAVGRISRQLKRSATSNAIAARFRARPDLAKGDNKAEWSDLVRAYLLIDAALG